MSIQNKASFDSCYQNYSPKEYARKLVDEAEYYLPFQAASLLREYLSTHAEALNTTVIGSGHGLDIAALKYGYTHNEILEFWSSDDAQNHSFADGDSRFKVVMVDISAPPLQFASDVGLCSSFYVCDLTGPWPKDLSDLLSQGTDLLICIGAAAYFGKDTFSRIIDTVRNGRIKYFYFSALSIVEKEYISLFENSKLSLERIGRVRQRGYVDADEQQRIVRSLVENDCCFVEDRECLMTSLYIASKELQQF
ncbi:MAG: hypothetical protein ACREPR_14040 [Brasilonema sp.]